MTRSLRVSTRRNVAGTASAEIRELEWDPMRAAVLICDMWDRTNCISAERRVREMARHMNEVVRNLRTQGALIVHAPGGCAAYYNGTPARVRAMTAPHVESRAPIDWNSWNCDRHHELPRTLTTPGPCSCDSGQPCCEGGQPYPWTRQTPEIEIADDDAVTDDGQEFFNLLQEQRATQVIIMGVHTNVCVLGREYGIRQLVFSGMAPLLCSDLTDSFHRDPRGHTWGTGATIAHIERYWCPSVRSDDLVGGADTPA